MATIPEMKTKIAKLPINMDRMDGFVNGPASGPASEVTVDGGIRVKTISRLAAEAAVDAGTRANVNADNIGSFAEDWRDALGVNVEAAPDWYGAVGDGITNDLVALLAASMATHNVRLTPGKTYLFGTSSTDNPAFFPVGFGKLKWKDVELGGYTFDFDVNNESIWSTPDSWFHAARVGASVSPEYPPYAPPGRGDLTNIFNTVISQRSGLRNASLCQNVTAYGANIGVRAESWAFTDAFGADAMMFARFSDRNLAIGTETMVWLGAPDRAYLQETNHDFYRNTPPDLWTVENTALEALHPGIGQRIYDFADYATEPSQVAHNSAVGRDALCHLLRGVNNNALGYQSGVMLLHGSENAFFGMLSGRNMVFGSNNCAFGVAALRDANDTNQATAVGYGSMRTAKAASNAVAIGYLTGDGVLTTTNAILIGAYAGSGYGGSLAQRFVLGNAPVGTKNPLLQGDLANGRVGVNTPIAAERSNFHVRVGAGSGASQAQEAGLLIEGPSLLAISLESGNSGATQAINFGYVGDPTRNRIESAGSGQLLFKTNGEYRWRYDASGHHRPHVDNGYNIGTAAFRAATLFAGTGTINTSDAREKTTPEAIDDAVLDAWADVSPVAYRWLASVAAKGDFARTHFGLIAQQVKDAFEAHALDATRYGLLCHDTWGDAFEPVFNEGDEEVGSVQVLWSGDRWGLRADQCMFVEAAYQRRRMERLEARMAKLEAQG